MAGNSGRTKGPLALVSPDADLGFYCREAARRGGSVLVLGCANGRVAWGLAGAGAKVLAVDPSAVMIAAAEERRAEEPRETSERLHLRTSDLRALRLSERFDAVVAPQNAIGLMATLQDLDGLFATVAHHLKATGALLLDAAHPKPAELQQDADEVVPPYLEPRRPLFTPHLRERRRGIGPGRTATSSIRRLRVGQYYAPEVDASLVRAGLRACERYGDFAGKPFAAADPLQVVVATWEAAPV